MAGGVANAINQFVGMDDERRAAELLVMKMQQQPDRWQTIINMVEAKHRSIFVAGWRSAAVWVCVFGLFYTFIGRPFNIVLLNVLASLNVLPTGILAPEIDTGELLSLLFGMLGLGALRIYEKKGLTG